MNAGSALGSALRRDRWVIFGALFVLTALAWAYVAVLALQMQSSSAATSMPDMPGMDMSGSASLAPGFASLTLTGAAYLFGMWAVMMVGMMTPSVAPMLLIYMRVAHQAQAAGRPLAATGWFACGYLLSWCLFSIVAVLAQWVLTATALLSPMMVASSRVVGGLVLLAAGIYQWLPIKDACLAQCHAPLAFIQKHGGFQEAASGSMRLGLLHGLYCVGCCWALMALLFVGGVMNLLWIAALMVFVLLEKLVPHRRLFSRSAGVVAAAVGVWMIASHLLAS